MKYLPSQVIFPYFLLIAIRFFQVKTQWYYLLIFVKLTCSRKLWLHLWIRHGKTDFIWFIQSLDTLITEKWLINNIHESMFIVHIYWVITIGYYFPQKIWKILKEMGIPDHMTCLLRNLYAGQEATVRTGHETTDWFQIRKGEHQGCIMSPCLFNLYAEYIMRNAGLVEAQIGSRLLGEISIISYTQMTPPLWQKAKN